MIKEKSQTKRIDVSSGISDPTEERKYALLHNHVVPYSNLKELAELKRKSHDLPNGRCATC